jgi:lipid II:glycine glycyltransferase (peptidoglycan interpeptide bridge formation enzyme)
VIRQGRRLAGAVLSFYFRETVLPYYAGAYAEFYRAGINNFMYAELMRHSAARGFTRFDFGRSKRGTGAYAFKRGWGMREQALPYRVHLVKAQQLPNLNPTNPKFKLLIEAWKKLPLGVTRLLGPPIVKYLP